MIDAIVQPLRARFARSIVALAGGVWLVCLGSASAQVASVEEAIRELDIAIAVAGSGGPEWVSPAEEGLSLAPTLVTVLEGQTLDSLLQSRKIQADARSLSIFKALNPDLPDNYTIHAGQQITLLEIEGQAGDVSRPWVLLPYLAERSEAKSAFDSVLPEVSAIPDRPETEEFLDAFEKAASTYRTTFWEDREMQQIAARTFEQSAEAIEQAKFAGFESAAAQDALSESASRLKALSSVSGRKSLVPLRISTELIAGTAAAPVVACQVYWGYGVPERWMPVDYPLAEPIKVYPSDVFVAIRQNGAPVSQPVHVHIGAVEFIDRSSISRTIRVSVPCG